MGRVVKPGEMTRRPARLADRERGRASDPAARIVERAIADRDREVVRLATGMARRLIGDAVDRDPSVLSRIYDETLRQAGGLAPAVLRINPEDRRAAPAEWIEGAEGIEVVEDPRVERFGCVLEALGTRVERGLEPMARMLAEALEGEEP